MTRKAHPGLQNSAQGLLFPGKLFSVILLIFFLYLPSNILGQEDSLYDEIPVYVRVQNLGMTEIDAAIKGEEVYLPLSTLFDFLKIRNIPSADLNTVTGFFINPEATYSVDRLKNQITFNGRIWQVEDGDLVKSETNLYLRSIWYGRIFGLDCKFTFRDLTVTIETKLELPGIREMKLEEMRNNMKRLKGEVVVDTTIGRNYPGFRFGMANWSVYATELAGGLSQARLNLSLGSVIAGGEATASLNYYTGDPFSEKLQYYLWRYVNNDRTLLRQVMAGKIISNATASIYDPVVGIQLTNAPTTFRRSFGSYTLTDRTEPGWTVELYVNNVLVDFVKADASGFFSFDVPLVYGNTQVKLKYYGPWGEERTREQNITIPYNFLPVREFEYVVSAGVVEDTLWSRFSRASASYGATRFLTIGGGVEYLSSVTSTPVMPFANASLRVTSNLLLSAEYTHGVRAKGTLTYRFPSNIQLDLNYVWYDRNQKAITYNYREERKASLSLPVKIRSFVAYSRLSYNQTILPASKYSNAEWMLAGSLYGINANLTTFGIFAAHSDPNVYSNLSIAVRLPAGFLIIPQVQYSYTGHEFISAKFALEKKLLSHGYVSASYEQNFMNNLKMAELGMRYDFSFAQTGVTVRQTNKQATFVEYARGSLINDSRTKYVRADNRTNVGRGGISIIPFLDLNANGVRDAGEPRAYGLNIHSNGGRLERSDKDTTIHIVGLEPYTKYFIEVDENSFDNISWRIDKKSLAVVVDPNMLKLIEIPVTVRGEATGKVVLGDNGSKTGMNRVIVDFYNNSGSLLTKVLTEEDGYYSYFGLAPGSYYIRVDTAQLRKLKMTSAPDSISFSINAASEGDYIEGLDFVLSRIAELPDTTRTVPAEETVKKDTSFLVVHEVTRELVTINQDYYAVQFGAFRNKEYAEIMKKKVGSALDKNVELFEEDGFWKVRITGFADRDELNSYIPVIHAQGITEIWVITNKAVSREWLIKTREDSLAVVRETTVREPVSIAGTTIQLGTFSNQAETESITDRLLAAADKLVTVRQEGGIYKVQITGFADTSDVREFLPLLRQHGFTDIVVLSQAEVGLAPVTPRSVQQIQEVQPVQPAVPEEIKVEIPEVAEEAAPPPPLPRFVLNAGSYHKRSQAERAKNRIVKKLKLPVEIIEEWESYRVIVTGFFTREETYPYYPELAGLGFTDIFVYEKPLIDR
jgi:cell division protein FtsN